MTDDMTPSYWDCLNAGMTQAEAAEARGVTVHAVNYWAKKNGVRFKSVYLRASDIPEDKRAAFYEMRCRHGMKRDEILEALGLEGLV